MKRARMLGNYIKHLSERQKLSTLDLSRILECEENLVESFLKGRMLISFKQLANLSKTFDVTIENLFAGDEDTYAATVVHCMNKFDKSENREKILDIIDDYVDIIDAVGTADNSNESMVI